MDSDLIGLRLMFQLAFPFKWAQTGFLPPFTTISPGLAVIIMRSSSSSEVFDGKYSESVNTCFLIFWILSEFSLDSPPPMKNIVI